MEALSDVDGEDDVFYDCDDLDGLLGLNAVEAPEKEAPDIDAVSSSSANSSSSSSSNSSSGTSSPPLKKHKLAPPSPPLKKTTSKTGKVCEIALASPPVSDASDAGDGDRWLDDILSDAEEGMEAKECRLDLDALTTRYERPAMYKDTDVTSFGKDRTARCALRRRFCKVNGVIQKLSSAVSGLATVWNTRQLRRCKHANPEQIPGQSRHRKRSGERES